MCIRDRLSFCQPRALHLTSIAPCAARACIRTVSAPFFFVLPTGSKLCPRAGILESRRNNQRPRKPVFPFAEGPTGPRANLRQQSGPSSRDITGLRELVQVGLLWPRLPESVPGPLRSAPSLRKQAALDGICRDFFFSSSSILTVYMGLSTGVHFTSNTAGRNDWGSFSPGSTELTLQPHQSATA